MNRATISIAGLEPILAALGHRLSGFVLMDRETARDVLISLGSTIEGHE